ncbi:prefoldin subunit beta [Candidatus Micrarchaeota archaeon]|nr:prefoldin subunit beta [Candidatus Micrarchaeota archaeon]
MAGQDDLVKAQQLQQQLQIVAMQKQQFSLQNAEIDRALNELGNASVAYRVAGSVMVEKSVPELKTQLSEEKESVEVRLKALTRQEESLLNAFEDLRKRLEPMGGDDASITN